MPCCPGIAGWPRERLAARVDRGEFVQDVGHAAILAEFASKMEVSLFLHETEACASTPSGDPSPPQQHASVS
jgi:hypothetical protein